MLGITDHSRRLALIRGSCSSADDLHHEADRLVKAQAPPLTFSLSGAHGRYPIDMFATGNNEMVAVSHSSVAILDNTAPITTIVEPTATEYPHSAVLRRNYSANDGTGSGVASTTGSLDGSTTLSGHGLDSGQASR